ncbi:hypothetical protein [Pantoea sp.]|uniref:hypothetical protein n=1 Tax=Pantoea sp. TaxID=69393 RepID=UPI0028AFFA92|nr:hypothetical protein [Pantoea sp.]
MEDLAKTIQQKYIDELVSKYPIHRFVILFIFVISTYSYNSIKLPLLTSLMDLKISFLFDFKDGLLSKVSIFQLFTCVALTAITGVFFERATKSFFALFISRYDIPNLTKTLQIRYERIKTSNDLVNYYLSKDINADLEKKKIRLRCFTVNIEYLTAILVAVVWGVSENGFMELFSALIICLSIAMLQFKLFIFYIESFIPLHVAEKVLQGTDIDIPPPL